MFILASTSPRRKELMKDICPSFSIIAKEIDEEASYKLSPLEAVKDIAYRKGIEIARDYPNDVVISADTIVTINGKIIGKPKSKEHAFETLSMLSGKKHEVITAFSIFHNGQVIRDYCVSEVYFANLSEQLINEYIKSGNPMDKAGAYGVQDNDKFHIIDHINGDYHNIMGFPVSKIKSDLIENHLL